MSEKNQNLILFFEEKKDEFDIKNRWVRLYMNRFTIDEDDQTEIIGYNDINESGWTNSFGRIIFGEYFCKLLDRARAREKPGMNLHFILPLFIRYFYVRQRSRDDLAQKLKSTMEDYLENKSCLPRHFGNCYAFTVLDGFHHRKLVSKNYRDSKYQYQVIENRVDQNFLRTIPDGVLISINDDMERFCQQIITRGISHRHLADENVSLFHYKMLDENKINQMKQTVQNYNDHLSIWQRLSGRQMIMTQNDPNDNFLEFNCLRITFHF